MIDLAELRRVALAATPGSWLRYVSRKFPPKWSKVIAHGASTDDICKLFGELGSENHINDSEFISQFNPTTALELIERLERAERVVEAAKECLWVDECRCDMAYTGRGKHEPNMKCGELDLVREALAELDAIRGETK